LAAFVLNSWVLVAVVAISQFLGAVDVPFAPYRLVYTKLVKPSGIVKPNVIEDNPEPHRFAMLVGSVFNAIAAIALLVGAPALAWVLVRVVLAPANLNFWVDVCVGCLMYYQFTRFGVRGSTRACISR